MPFLTVPEAIAILSAGGIVIFPTETFLALGCDPASEVAVAAIYQIKKRPPDKPLPLIAANMEQASDWANLEACPARLLTRFWPGPLSILLPPERRLASCLLNSHYKIAIRISASGLARDLASGIRGLITATSANISTFPPCQEPAQLDEDLLAACSACKLPWGIVNGKNNCHYEAPSTLIEPVKKDGAWSVRIIREGAISRAALTDPEWSIA